ncbi:MAG: phosphoenolpyruvate synthase [Hyphomonadaceae bacterium]
MNRTTALVLSFDELKQEDVALVGGKNASLGEMRRHLSAAGIETPEGFATTSAAFWSFLDFNALRPLISRIIASHRAGRITLTACGARIRDAIEAGQWPKKVADAICEAYRAIDGAAVAVRSSATAEDLPGASFAGQHETLLNVLGEAALLDACRTCFASLFTDRAIAYREEKGFDHTRIALSAGVQRMVRADLGGSGVTFTIDPETGFPNVVVINSVWGLGEASVQGLVDPDEHQVFKPLLENAHLSPIVHKKCGAKAKKVIYAPGTGTAIVETSTVERSHFVLSEAEVLTLARWGAQIEAHYGRPMDIEWAKDGEGGRLFVLQARPETVHADKREAALHSFEVTKKGTLLLSGVAVGAAAAVGPARIVTDARDERFCTGDILVAETTNPDWMPLMRRAAAVVTSHGGRTSHAAIVSRELGVPAVIGAASATTTLHDGQSVTVSCAEGEVGCVYDGAAEIRESVIPIESMPKTRTQLMLNLANPAAAYRWWRLPVDGVGLARMEFVIANHIRVHPMALLHTERVGDAGVRAEIERFAAGSASGAEFFVEELARGLSRLAAAFYPKPVIIRTSDFKSNEYARLLGGGDFEPPEENPMIGLRGAARYYSPVYREAFALECQALKRLREEMGFDNVVVMIPFCRSVREADRVLAIMADEGLQRGVNGLQVYVMCEVPSNVILAKDFAERFDGFSIGSNDLTQLTLGVDRDSEALAEIFDEQDEAVEWMIAQVISAAHLAEAKVGLCGQAPSDHPEFAEFLVDHSIDSISISPDSFAAVKLAVDKAERAQLARWKSRA